MNLLIGATGFVGGHVVEYLFGQNEISKGVFRKGAHLKLMDLNGVQGVEADLLDHHALHEAFEGVETVYSIASPMPGSDDDFGRFGAEGIRNILDVAKEAKVKTLVHLSTADVYGFRRRTVDEASEPSPRGQYQESKLLADRTLLGFAKRDATPRVVVIRSARAIGPRDASLTVPLLRMVESGRVVIPRSATMSFSHPKDIAKAMYHAATGKIPTGRVCLLKSFDATPEAVARGLADALGKTAEVSGAGLLRRSTLAPYTTEQLRASLMLEGESGWQELGCSPEYDLRRTCEETVAWYRREPWSVEG